MISATITERDENPGETRLELSLGAANLSVASVQLETAEPLFMRQVSVAFPKVSEDTIQEETIGQGTVYRVAVEGQPPSQNLSVPLDSLVSSRELFLLIKNGNSPPLPISAVRVERRPVYLVFLARQPGTYHLLTGNAQCDAPRYDLAALGMNLKGVAVSPIKVSPPSDNPDFRAPEVLPGLEVTGAALDVSDWKFRKPVKISKRRWRAANRARPRSTRARETGLRGFARVGRQQPGALHHPAHVHQPRAHSDRYRDDGRERSEVEPLDHQTSRKAVCRSHA